MSSLLEIIDKGVPLEIQNSIKEDEFLLVIRKTMDDSADLGYVELKLTDEIRDIDVDIQKSEKKGHFWRRRLIRLY